MSILIVGANGATSIRLVEELLHRGHDVKAIVRSPDRFPDHLRNHVALDLIQASVLELSDRELEQHVAGCDAIASCLGHNLAFKGLLPAGFMGGKDCKSTHFGLTRKIHEFSFD